MEPEGRVRVWSNQGARSVTALALLAALGVACGGSKHTATSGAATSAGFGATPIAAGTPANAALVTAPQLQGGWNASSAAPAEFGAARAATANRC